MGGKTKRDVEKILVLVRHAHRDTEDVNADNGLSSKGRDQSQKLLEIFRTRFQNARNVALLSSPKRRCKETLEPMAKGSASKVHVDPRLDEGASKETGQMFEARIQAFIDWWMSEGPEVVIACSHGDWIPVALQILTGARADVKKGAWVEIQVIEGKSRLATLIQNNK
ncbi:MAG TPA: phosphoglycerate mutase family protein [Bdellovibrionota bacterium]|nr:phosphoglycerate mutase family protein [Bdellovibrionota bacterium]